MNLYFTSITRQLNLKKNSAIKEFEKTSSTTITRLESELFTFNLVSSDEIKREILVLNNKKPQGKEISQLISLKMPLIPISQS